MHEERLLEAQGLVKKRIREMIVPLLLFIFGALGVLLLSTWQGARSLDRIEVENSLELFENLFKDEKNKLTTVVFDSTYWDAALEKLVLELDKEWADDNVGTYLQDLYGLQSTFLIDEENGTKLSIEGGSFTETDVAKSFPEIIERITELRKEFEPETIESARTEIIRRNDKTYLIALAVVQGDDVDIDVETAKKLTAKKNVLVLLKELDQAYFSNLSQRFSLPELSIELENPEFISNRAVYPLNDASNNVLAWITWQPDLRSGEFIQSILRSTSLIALSLVGLMCFIAYRAVGLRKIIDLGMLHFLEEKKATEQYERAIADLSQGPSLYDITVGEAFDKVSTNIVKALDIDQVGLWEYDTNTTGLKHVTHFDREENETLVLEPFFAVDFPDFFAAFKDGLPMMMNDKVVSEELDGIWQSWFPKADEVALMVIPVRRRRHLKGLVYFLRWNPDCEWGEDKVRFANSLVDFVSIIFDAQHQKRIEEELRNAKNIAEAASATKSEFLANMSHELRTPLNAIIGFSDLMKQHIYGKLGSAQYDDYVDDINMSAKHLLSLINEILDVAKTESGVYRVYPKEVDVKTEVAAASRLIKGRFKNRNFTVELDIEPDTEIITIDPKSLRQILLNLMSNSVKFCESGCKIDISVYQQNGDVTIRVTDNGIGIPKDKLDDVFVPFQQVENALSKKYEGTGLGLSITKALIELHGGHIEIESAEGEGTSITMTIPMVSDEVILGQEEKVS